MNTLYCRLYQRTLQLASYFLPWRKPTLLEGANSLNKLPEVISRKGISKILIVTDQGISSLGLVNSFLQDLDKAGVRYTVYDKTVPNPTLDNIEEALKLYQEQQCEGIVAFGGGSPMDCAKGVGARVANPHKSISQMKGVLKVRRKLPPLFAIPTTAGTGSEATLAAVISDPRNREKYPVNDTALIPHYAVLDPLLTVGLPKHITSTTGLDALTHAVEAYIGRSNTQETTELSRKAVRLIFDNLYIAYSQGENVKARENMLKASYYAGVAFTRAYVGYIHALAHALGGFYGVPHGLANAVILPCVLEYYGEAVHERLAELADVLEMGSPGDSHEQKATLFIEAIKELSKKMNIPRKIDGILAEDIPLLVEHAWKEATPLYPVPRLLSRNDLNNILNLIGSAQKEEV
ncbi:iron-containing alcohol dehydrogenase [Desulfitobacterium hafniense DCB-2]|uniref:Iron-containing alcohol dehydrogenase n=1 Tax=Desulfitobacterium hafniense (strain DSM 10664 / DCB-2) TaxID=272564 RepID=B8FSK3_DESHD|nr:iron-containing alcohol dehydrogenase [Desulfitobacterium hafniense]ACL20214.1 iron-containing alcohol dehydrogenase [Desulfitobacterium hafniense DCB-2]